MKLRALSAALLVVSACGGEEIQLSLEPHKWIPRLFETGAVTQRDAGEFGVSGGLYDNPAKLDWSYQQAVNTQASRARQAARLTADLYNLPFLVGSHWFTWRDFDSTARQATRGLFRAPDEPWTELQDALRAVHRRIPQAR